MNPSSHPQPAPETPLALRPVQAAKALGISERSLWQLTHDGHVPHLKLGRVTLYPVDQLRVWLKVLSRQHALGPAAVTNNRKALRAAVRVATGLNQVQSVTKGVKS